jgi:hypothetical protein
VQNPILGETYGELNEMQVKVWDEESRKMVTVVVTGQSNHILMQKPLSPGDSNGVGRDHPAAVH